MKLPNLRDTFAGLGAMFKAEQTEAEKRQSQEATYKKLIRRAAVLFVDAKPLAAGDSEKLFGAAGNIDRKAATVESDLQTAIQAEQLRRHAAKLPELQEQMRAMKQAKEALGFSSPVKAMLKERAIDLERVRAEHGKAKADLIAASEFDGDAVARAQVYEAEWRQIRTNHPHETALQVKEAEARFTAELNLARAGIDAQLQRINEAKRAGEDLLKIETANHWLFDARDAAAVAADRARERRRAHLVHHTDPETDQSQATYPVVLLELALRGGVRDGLADREWIPLPGQNESDLSEMVNVLLATAPHNGNAPDRSQHVIYLRERGDGLPHAGRYARDMTRYIHELIDNGKVPDPTGFIVIPWVDQSLRTVEKLKAQWAAKYTKLTGQPVSFEETNPARFNKVGTMNGAGATSPDDRFDKVSKSRHADRAASVG